MATTCNLKRVNIKSQYLIGNKPKLIPFRHII